MIRWVKAHPYTTATPFMLAATVLFFRVTTGAAWWRCAAFTLVLAVAACFSAWQKRRRGR